MPTNKLDNPLPPLKDAASTSNQRSLASTKNPIKPPAKPPDPEGGQGPSPSKVAKIVKCATKKYRFTTCSGTVYAVSKGTANPETLKVGSHKFNSSLRKLAHSNHSGLLPYADDLKEACNHIAALAEIADVEEVVWQRVARVPDGIEIDLGDKANTRIVISSEKVQTINKGSKTLFHRTPHMLPFAMPANKGDLRKLLRYLNLREPDQWLLIIWIAYTLAHPKISTTNYVILALRGNRGVGKSTLAWILALLTDPSLIGLQAFPSKATDLAISAQNAHVLFYDNLRRVVTALSDALCIMSTSGYLSNRMLYSDDQESVKKLHGACVLNGIHPFITEPDLAQRCLHLLLLKLNPGSRQSELQLKEQFEKELPEIFKGILDLIADIFTHLPSVKPIQSERMLDFVHWLAAAEKSLGFEEGYLQRSYSATLTGAMRSALEDDPLAINVIRFAKAQKNWTGTPMQLLALLAALAGLEGTTAVTWPKSPASLSIRLKNLQAQLSGAGVDVQLGKRSKERQISIIYTGRSS
ncbi:MAG: hypothetical protein V7742_14080 [Halioglobus sp.]